MVHRALRLSFGLAAVATFFMARSTWAEAQKFSDLIPGGWDPFTDLTVCFATVWMFIAMPIAALTTPGRICRRMRKPLACGPVVIIVVALCIWMLVKFSGSLPPPPSSPVEDLVGIIAMALFFGSVALAGRWAGQRRIDGAVAKFERLRSVPAAVWVGKQLLNNAGQSNADPLVGD